MFTLMGHDRFNFQSTTIKLMNGRRSSCAWRTQAHRGCKMAWGFFAVIYEVVSAGARHSSSTGGTGEGTQLVLGNWGSDLWLLSWMTHVVNIDKCH